MDLYAATVNDFGRRVGLPALQPDAAGRVDLQIEKIGRLQLEKDGEAVIVALARPWPVHAEAAGRTALALCHWRENHPWTIHAGLKGEEWLLFAARVPEGELDLPALDALVGYLANLQDQVERAG